VAVPAPNLEATTCTWDAPAPAMSDAASDPAGSDSGQQPAGLSISISARAIVSISGVSSAHASAETAFAIWYLAGVSDCGQRSMKPRVTQYVLALADGGGGQVTSSRAGVKTCTPGKYGDAA